MGVLSGNDIDQELYYSNSNDPYGCNEALASIKTYKTYKSYIEVLKY